MNINFTQNNHLKYTVDDRLFGDRQTPYEKFKVTVGKIDRDIYRKSNWLLEQYRTAEMIYEDLGKDLVVLFSGGTDSEIVLRAFSHIGIRPRTVFIKFPNNYNSQDLIIANAVAAELGINLEVIDFNVIDFYRSGQAAEFAAEIQCRQIAYLTVYKQIQLLQAPAVMGGELMFRRAVSASGSKWYYCFRENEDGSAMRFSTKYNLPLVNEWFSYTPEMMGYYLDCPGTQELINTRYNYKLSSVSTKNDILRGFMPSIIEKIKTHGYEQLIGFNAETYQSLHSNYVRKLEASLDGIYVDDLRVMLFGENNDSN